MLLKSHKQFGCNLIHALTLSMIGDTGCRVLLQVRCKVSKPAAMIGPILSRTIPCHLSCNAIMGDIRMFMQVLGYVYPAYLCFKDIEGGGEPEKLKLWCMYWYVFSLIVDVHLESLGHAVVVKSCWLLN